MASQAIGSLFVALGLDSAAFTAGVKHVQGVTGKLQKGFERFGKAANSIGAKLSMVSAGIAAAGLAGAAMVKQTADAAIQIDRQSKLANTSATDFQRMAAGAKFAGIEQDKLADILKDVNDRVGDFLQTGGGPMADFFEKVAPQVGVTAEQFKNLSGPQALQLYVDTMERAGLSQQEMTFYMEAMASDATALIPLLANGGKAMAAYGDAAQQSGAIMSDKLIAASVAFNQKLTVLSDRLLGARNQLAEALMPVINQFLDVLISKGVPALQSFIGFVGQAIDWFGQLPGPVQEAAGAIALALGVGGPIMLAIGAVSTAISVLIGATGPIGLFILAASTLAAAWAVWGDDIKATFGSAIDWITAKYNSLQQGWAQLQTDMANAVAAAVATVKAKFDELLTWFRELPAKMLEIGGQIVQGLIDGIMAKWEALKAQVYALADGLPQWAKDALGIHSPSRVFREIGQFVTQGLGLGIRDGVPEVDAAMQSVTDAVSDGGGLISGLEGFRDVAETVFRSVAIEGKKLGDVLRDLASNWLGNAANSLLGSAFDTLFGIGANANGTNNWRGGLTRVNERGGEIMNLPRGTQIIPNDISKRMADGAAHAGPVQISVNVSGARGNSEIEAMVAQGVRSGIAQYDRQALPTRIKQISADGRRIG